MKHILIILGILFSIASVKALEKSSPEKIAEVQQRNQQLLPYDITQSLQTFTKTVHGGVQHVVVKAPGNSQQIKLIQAYLSKLAGEFAKGDFSTTEHIHGAAMPGLAQLKTAQPYDIKFDYKPLENGAQIHYATEYPQFVQALHLWFDAQTSEHGGTIIPEHTQHHTAPSE